jgi:hypothetical protein
MELSALIPRLTRMVGTTPLPPSSPPSYTLPGLSRQTHAPTNAFSQQGPSPFSDSPRPRLLLCGHLTALAAMLTKGYTLVLTNMSNAALRLPEVSVRCLHGRLLEVPLLSLDDLRANFVS